MKFAAWAAWRAIENGGRKSTARLVSMTLQDAARSLPYTAIGAVILAGVIAILRQPLRFRPLLPYAPWSWALSAAAVTGALAARIILCRRSAAFSQTANGGAATSWLLALQAGFFLFLIPVAAATRHLPEDFVSGWLYPFVDKRWLVAVYNVTILTVLVLPVAFHRLRGQISAPLTDEGRLSTPIAPRSRSWVHRAAGAIVVATLTWYFAGPPWHLDRHHRPIDWHEQAHLGSLQAISKGYVPYIGPASTQYGPGSQLMMYAWMKGVGRFDIVGFRGAWAVFNLLGFFIVAAVAYCWIGITGLFAVSLLAVAYSPLAFYGTSSDGTLAGYYGWANALRYAGAIVVVPAVTWIVSDAGAAGRGRRAPAVILGAAWALSAWVAQENLSAVIVAGGLVLLLLWLTGSVSGQRTVFVIGHVTLGFLSVAAPVLGFYAWHRALSDFVSNYVLVPRFVAAGYSNMWWPQSAAVLPERRSYYFTFPFLLAMAICTIWRLPAFRVEPLDVNRRRLLAFLCVQVACFQTALFRSDPEHLMSTMAALPFVLVLGIVDIPRFVADRWATRVVFGAVFLLVALWIYPVLGTKQWDRLIVAPLAKLQPSESLHSLPDEYQHRVGIERATPFLAQEPALAVGSGLSMREFLDFASDLHDVVGTRKTYVGEIGSGCAMTSRGGCVWAGAVYFMADLVPAPYPLDRDTMTINDPLRDRAVEHIRAYRGDYECLISSSLEHPESAAFLSAHPAAAIVRRQLGRNPVYILLSPDGS